MSDENHAVQLSRRTLLSAIGTVSATGVGVGTATGAAAGQTPSTTTYTLTVTDPSGDSESVSVEDEFELDEYGGHIRFSCVGDTRADNDSGIVDQVRLDSGEIIEDWEDEGERGGWEESYHRTATGGGEFQVVESPTAGGDYALGLFSGCCGDAITADESVLSISAGTAVSADISHQTDESPTFAHRTVFVIGCDSNGEGGITAALSNPGSQRTAGARLQTPNNEARIEFEPELQEFYTFTIEIGETGTDGTDDADEGGDENDDADEDGDETEDDDGNVDENDGTDGNADENDEADESADGTGGTDGTDDADDSGPGFGVGSGLAAIGGAGYLLSRRLADDTES